MDESRLEEDLVKSVYLLPLEVANGSLIDFETTGVPRKNHTHEIVTLGYLNGNDLTIVQRKTREHERFYSEIKGILERLPRPFYSYNAGFERDIIQIELGMRIPESDCVDLMLPWRSKAEELRMKWPSLDDLVSEPESYFHTERVTGSRIPGLLGEVSCSA